MKRGIMVCGLNGSGKSTLGRALAQRLGWAFLDVEDCFFSQEGPAGGYKYGAPRPREEAAALLAQRARQAEDFLCAGVKGDYGPAFTGLLTTAVWLRADPATRSRRVRQRSFERFGQRMLPGGDLWRQEEDFFAFAAGREEAEVEGWLHSLGLPVLQADGTRPVQENVERLAPLLIQA